MSMSKSQTETAPDENTSPLTLARAAGWLTLAIAIVSPIGMMVIPSKLFVSGNAAATAERVLGAEALFRGGMICDSLVFLLEVLLTAVLYVLMKPVSRVGALSATFARLAMAVVQGVNVVISGTVLLMVSGSSLATFAPAQRQALMLASLDAHRFGVYVWEAFFALHCAILGVLIFKSKFFPRVFGVLMVIAGLGYGLHSWGNLLWPAQGSTFEALVGIGALLGEVPFMLWLLVKGVDAQKWKARAIGRAD